MPALPRRRLSTPSPNQPQRFQPGNQVARGYGRPPGSRNKTTNLVVAGITAAVLEYGKQYLAEHDLDPDTNVLSDVDAFKGFMLYCIDKDLRGFLSLIKGLIPRDVTLNITQETVNVDLTPAQTLAVLEARGIRLPRQYRLSTNHGNDDDDVTEAEIVQALDGPAGAAGSGRG